MQIIHSPGGEYALGGMWLHTVDHVTVCFQDRDQLARVALVEEHVATVTARDDVIVAPEVGLLDHRACVSVPAELHLECYLETLYRVLKMSNVVIL